MIHLISIDGGLVDRALQSILSCYGKEWQSTSVKDLAEWQIDDLISDSVAHQILTNCDEALLKYIKVLSVDVKLPAIHYWQVLSPSIHQWETITDLIVSIKQTFPGFRSTFVLSEEYNQIVWNQLFINISEQTRSLIQNNFIVLPCLNLQELNYTSHHGVRNCLVYTRLNNRVTIRKVNNLVSAVMSRLSHLFPS